MSSKPHIFLYAAFAVLAQTETDEAKARLADLKCHLSAAAEILDSDDPVQAEALQAVIEFDSRIRKLEHAVLRTSTKLSKAMLQAHEANPSAV
jgi:hypothetical protein